MPVIFSLNGLTFLLKSHILDVRNMLWYVSCRRKQGLRGFRACKPLDIWTDKIRFTTPHSLWYNIFTDLSTGYMGFSTSDIISARVVDMVNEIKKPTADYILNARKNKLTFNEAVEKIISENQVAAAPIPVVAIARNLGFSVYKMKFKDRNIAGIMADAAIPVSPFREKRVMVINREDYPTRQNFTVAHEIAHFVLHCNSSNNFYERYMHDVDKDQKSDVEKMADSFAANLLMPERMVREYISTFPSTATLAELVFGITDKFFVSAKAANRRLIELGYHTPS